MKSCSLFLETLSEIVKFFNSVGRLFQVLEPCMVIGVRDGGAGGAAAPPKKITKSKSRANVQHKSGEEWEIKKSKSQKAPSLLSKQRQSGNIRFAVGRSGLQSRSGKIFGPLKCTLTEIFLATGGGRGGGGRQK